MNTHLNERQLTEVLLGFADESEQQHLQKCEPCRAKVAAENDLFSRFGKEARSEAQRTEDFWARQRLVVSRRMEQSEQRRTLRVVWGAAATVAAGLVLWVVMAQVPGKPVPPPSSHPNDDVLLMQVAAALERGSPEAFAPAEVLTRELNRSAKPKARVSEVKGKSEGKTK